MRTVRGRLRSERGSVVVMAAVSLFAMLALAALAVDLASLRDAKAEAQRSADVIALAGAAAFRDYPSTDPLTVDSAQGWGIQVARKNMVRGDTLDVRNETSQTTSYAWGSVRVVQTNQVTLNVIPDSQKVRAWVRHRGVVTFFGGLLGVPYGHVQAMATAWATTEGPKVNCLKPFAMPDMWFESDTTTQDVNKNHYMEPITDVTGNTQDGESWKYQPASIGGDDYYLPYDPLTPPPPGKVQTGYGSGLRSSMEYEGDIGLPILLKPQTGSGNTDPSAERMGNAFWLLDLNPDANFKAEVGGCSSAAVGDTVPYDKGSKTAVRQAVDALNKLDPDAEWDEANDRVVGSSYPNWTDSPRVVVVALIDPKYWIANSSQNKPDPGSLFTNFVRIFFEDVDPKGPPENIHARYIGPAPGTAGGTTGGPLVKVLQLIE
jgi:Flp pilus assembly protein TadG